MTLASRKKWQQKLRLRRKTVWKGMGRGRSRLHLAKQVKPRAMPRVESGIPQSASLQALLRKPWLPKLSGFRTQETSGPKCRKTMKLRGLGA